ncbi:MAG: hypothetical protein JEZ07_10190 [Phycisphaerae bacterium]|nr:hypothetical protein [Phycisphaerae bacterium]
MKHLSIARAIACLVILTMLALPGPVTKAFAAEKAQTFDLKKVSLLDIDIPPSSRYMVMAPHYAPGILTSKSPKDDNVKAYPKLKSDKPLYGHLLLGSSYTISDSRNKKMFFVLDESKGTGKGYDTITVDANFDNDLTNDKAVNIAKKSPLDFMNSGSRNNTLLFDSLKIKPQGQELTIWPLVVKYNNDMFRVGFFCENAYVGKIKLIGKTKDVLVTQSQCISIAFDSPATHIFFMNKDRYSSVVAGQYHLADGMYWTFAPSENGDKLAVNPYMGKLGKLKLSCGDLNVNASNVTLTSSASYLRVDANSGFLKDSTLTLPVGKYKISGVSLIAGDYDVRLANYSDDSTAAFPLEITADKTIDLDIKSLKAVFNAPAKDNVKIKNNSMYVSAYFCNPKLGVKLSSIQDKSKVVREVKSGNGTYKYYERLEPAVKIFDSTGKEIAQGKMPFG